MKIHHFSRMFQAFTAGTLVTVLVLTQAAPLRAFASETNDPPTTTAEAAVSIEPTRSETVVSNTTAPTSSTAPLVASEAKPTTLSNTASSLSNERPDATTNTVSNSSVDTTGTTNETTEDIIPITPTWSGRILFNGSEMGGPNEVITTVATGDETVNIEGVPLKADIKFLWFKIGKKYFVALTDKNGNQGPDNVWLLNTPVNKIFPKGLKGDISLYPVVLSSTALPGTNTPAHAVINDHKKLSEILPDTTALVDNTVTGEITVLNNSAERYYIKPNAIFTWDKPDFAMWAYFNPGGILSNSSVWDEKPRDPQSGNPNNLTHTDLVINLDERIHMADEVTLQFSSSAYKAIAVYTTDYSKLASVPDPEINNPNSNFKVNLQGNHSFIVRAALRNTFSKTGGMTVTSAEEIFKPMALTSPDDKAFWIEKSDADSIMKGAEPLRFTGTIKAVVKPPSDLPTTAVDPIEARISLIDFDTTSVSWSKTDDNNAPVGGAGFELRGASGTSFNVVDAVNEDEVNAHNTGVYDSDPRPGFIKITGLPLDTYTIKETAAPRGYILGSDSLNAILTTEALNAEAGALINKPDAPAPIVPDTSTPVVPYIPSTNEPAEPESPIKLAERKLPHTGEQSSVAMLVTSLTGVCVVSAGALTLRVRRNR